MGLLSIPALAKAKVCSVFLLDAAILLDMNKAFEPIGRVCIHEDGLYDIGTRGTAESNAKDEEKTSIAHLLIASSLQSSVPKVDSDKKSEYSDSDLQTHSENSEFGSGTDSDLNTNNENIECESECKDELHTERIKSGNIDDNLERKKDDDAVGFWHPRFAHQESRNQIKKLVNKSQLPNLSCNKKRCKPCTIREYRKSSKRSLTRAKESDHLPIDIVGKIKQLFIHGRNYLVTVVDEFSRFVYAKTIKHDSAASEIVVRYSRWFER